MGKSSKQGDGHGEKKRSKDKDQKNKVKDKAKEKDMKKKKKKDRRTDQHEAGKHRHKEKKHRPSGSDTSGASSSSSSSSEEDIGLLSPRQQLQRERQAINTLRDLLSTHPAARKDLRELLWTLDQGKAAHLAGVADEQLRTQLISMLKLLGCARAGTKGSFMLAPGQAKSLSVLGPVFDEAPRPPPPAPSPSSRPSTTTPIPGPAPAATQATTTPPTRRPTQGPSAPPEQGPTEPQAPVQGPTMPPARLASDSHNSSESDQKSLTTADGPGGVAGPPEGPMHGSDRPEGPAHASNQHSKEEPGRQEAVPGPRRIGPALPPPEVLAAAAAAAEEGLLGAPSDEEEEEEDGLMVGPVPPELLQEDEAMPEDAREAEVLRIMRILRDAQAAADASGAGKPAPLIALAADAYDVLGVSRETPAGEVKKRYMKLSLLIHPDKCNHKDAHAAFQAVAQAAKVLQDSGSRAALDEALDERKLRKMAMEAAVVAERERAWRVARGEELPGSASSMAVGGLGPIVRESWMTELPAEKAAALAGAMMNQVSQRAFSRFGIKARGDTSAWTDTPQQRSARERDVVLGAAQGPLLIAGAGGAQHGTRGTAADAKVLDAFNAQARKRTLLEQHMEQQQQQSAAAAKKSKTDDKPAATVSRPFDRERDLEIKRKPLDPAALLKNQEQLGQKFSSAGGARHFL